MDAGFRFGNAQSEFRSPGKKHLTATRLPPCNFGQLVRLPSISARSVGT
jgi:hypothetical protein